MPDGLALRVLDDVSVDVHGDGDGEGPRISITTRGGTPRRSWPEPWRTNPVPSGQSGAVRVSLLHQGTRRALRGARGLSPGPALLSPPRSSPAAVRTPTARVDEGRPTGTATVRWHAWPRAPPPRPGRGSKRRPAAREGCPLAHGQPTAGPEPGWAPYPRRHG
ncbi:hypothetical protein JOF58_002802 [Streptomyces cinnamonensis]|nr:hypothetical protein [Streptomyces virginiae]